MIELPIRRLRDDAVLPARAYRGDAGLDLSACERVELAPGERAVVVLTGSGLKAGQRVAELLDASAGTA